MGPDDLTATFTRPSVEDQLASGWNWAEAATDQWITAAEKAGLVAEVVSEEVTHVTREAAIVSVDGAEYVLEVHGDEVRAIPTSEA
jgi:hypothetical protein